MSCIITRGREKGCKDGVGGISYLYVINQLPNGELPFTIVDGQATAINPLVDAVYPFALIGDNNNFAENAVGDRNTGTFANTQTITAQLNKITKEDQLELTVLSQGYPHVVVKDKMGNYLVFGHTDGVDFTVATTSGGAKTDFNGYTLTGTATEGLLAPILASNIIEEFLDLVVPVTPPPSV